MFEELMNQLNKQDKKEEKTKRYVLYASEYGSRQAEGFGSFAQKFVKGDGNYLPHLKELGRFHYWFQIIDTKNKNKIVEERFGKK